MQLYEQESSNNQETFIPKNSGKPTALKSTRVGFQLAQINIVQQSFKEHSAN
jgi:hypothetical protein